MVAKVGNRRDYNYVTMEFEYACSNCERRYTDDWRAVAFIVADSCRVIENTRGDENGLEAI